MINSIAFPFILLITVLFINFVLIEKEQFYYLSRKNLIKQSKIIILKSIRNLILIVQNKFKTSIVEFLLRLISLFIFFVIGRYIWKEEIVSLDLGLSLLVTCFISVSILDNFLSKQSSMFQLREHVNSLSIIVILIVLNLEFSIQNRKIDILMSLSTLGFCLLVTMLMFTSLRKINTPKRSVKLILESTVVLILCELLYKKDILSLDLINPYFSVVILIPYIFIANSYEKISSKQISNQNKGNGLYYFGIFLMITRLLLWKF